MFVFVLEVFFFLSISSLYKCNSGLERFFGLVNRVGFLY